MASSETVDVFSSDSSDSGSNRGKNKTVTGSNQPPNKKRKGDQTATGSNQSQLSKKKKVSEAWLHFDKDLTKGIARCNYCKKEMSYKGSRDSGTSHLMNHVNRYCTARKKMQSESGPMDNHLVGAKKADGSIEMVTHCFNAAKIREAIVLWIIESEQSFRQVEHPSFIRMLKTIDPRVEVPSRFTIAREVKKLFVTMATKVRGFFREYDGYVSLTTDTWTSVQNMPYMCVTAHYIDSNWEIQKKVIAFKVVGDHKANTIGKVLFEVIRDWGIHRIACITVDNASANKKAIDDLKKKLRKDEMLLEGKHIHFRCTCHIINIIVQEGLKASNDSIVKIRDAVRCIRSSPAREKAFKTYCESENLSFDGKLWLDTQTRWNSTYIMLDKAYPFRNAIMRMQCDEDWGLTDVDWEMAHLYLTFLGLFHDATQVLSATKHATINQYAMQMYTLQKVINERSTSDETQCLELEEVTKNMQEKVKKYWVNDENMNLLVCVASILDPRNKTSMTSEILGYLYPNVPDSIEWDYRRLLTQSRACLHELFDLYNKVGDNLSSSTNLALSDVSSASQQEARPSGGLKNLVKDFYASRSTRLLAPQITELEQYLDVDGLVDHHEGFDVIQWWKVNGHKYPTLQRICKDVLAIPVSTVASESTFSTGGRTITDFRSRLAPSMVEALICVQSWLVGGSFTLVNAVETIEVFDKDDDEVSGVNSTT